LPIDHLVDARPEMKKPQFGRDLYTVGRPRSLNGCFGRCRHMTGLATIGLLCSTVST
jgi:hypothetical protein